MRFVEKHTPAVENRLTAQTKKELHKKVANSKKSYHKGYPDETGYIECMLIDPKHNSDYNTDINICNHTEPRKTTIYTALLAFPHVSIKKHNKSGISINDITEFAFVDSYDTLQNPDNETRHILRERERFRMESLNSEYVDFENKVLTTKTDEKIIINAYRSAKTRVSGEPTVQDIKRVMNFKRNNFQRFFDEDISSLNPNDIEDIIESKTCSPILPQNNEHKQVLRYWINNPSASISEVVENTGISRGKFETFRLNLPELEMYDVEYIKNLSFDKDEMVQSLKSYISSTSHDMYACEDCSKWSYSVMSLSAHKMNSKDHDNNEVTQSELTDLFKTEEAEETKDIHVESEVSVDDMFENYAANKSNAEAKSLAESLYDSNIAAIDITSSALDESVQDVLKRLTDGLTSLEKKEVEKAVN